MEKKTDLLNNTVKEVAAGIGLLGILELLICFLFIGGGPWSLTMLKVRSMGGILLGCLFAAGWFFHMKQSLKKETEMEDKGAPFRLRRGYAFRLFAASILFLLVAWTDWVPVLAVLAGILTLKPAVYFQPLLHKLFVNYQKRDSKGL